MMNDVSLVIPCFNESKNLPALFEALMNTVPLREVIFVDDGSTDDTGILIKSFIAQKKISAVLIQLSVNSGKGRAVRTGILSAQGAWCITLDADLAVSLDQVSHVVDLLRLGNDVVIGSRVIPGAKVVVPQRLFRRILGSMFIMFANRFLALRVTDITCGCKGFSKEVAVHLFEPLRTRRWTYDAEILFRARGAHYRIKEMPVIWRHGYDSKVHIITDSIVSLVDLVKIRFLSV